MRDDVGEQRNLVDSHPQQARMMHERLKQWRRDIGAPVPTEPNPRYDAEAEAEALKKMRAKLQRG